MEPKISIVTVVYNGAKTIEQAIKSVLAQNYNNIEYIIIDGLSTDGTQEIIARYADSISCFVSEPDKGIYDAMNKGIAQATGDVIAFLNCDDWYEENVIAKIANYFQDVTVGMVFAKTNVIKKGKVDFIVKPDVTRIWRTMPCCHQGIFAKKSLFDEIGGYDLRFRICADYDWVLRAFNTGAKVVQAEEIVVNYRDDGFSSLQGYRMVNEFLHIAKANAEKQGMQNLILEIELSYRDELNKNRRDYWYQCVCERDVEYVRGLFNLKEAYYIWGTGFYGRMCYELFARLGVNIKGFIDNNIDAEGIGGCPIVSPKDIGECGIICVATFAYEKEIIEQLAEMKITRERWICFSEIYDKAIAHGIKKYHWKDEEFADI